MILQKTTDLHTIVIFQIYTELNANVYTFIHMYSTSIQNFSFSTIVFMGHDVTELNIMIWILKKTSLPQCPFFKMCRDGTTCPYSTGPEAFSLQILPKSLGPFCLLLFKMVAQNVIKFDQFQYLAANCCRFMTLLHKNLD